MADRLGSFSLQQRPLFSDLAFFVDSQRDFLKSFKPDSSSTDPTLLCESTRLFSMLKQPENPTLANLSAAKTEMQEWVKIITTDQWNSSSLFESVGLSNPGSTPKAFTVVSLYPQPIALTHTGATQVLSIALGLRRGKWDAPPGIAAEWRFKDFPERPAKVQEPEMNKKTQDSLDLTMYWKMHIVFRRESEPYLALNPVQYTGYRRKDLKQDVISKFDLLIDRVTKEKPAHLSDIKRHLLRGREIISRQPVGSTFRHPDREQIAIALGLNFVQRYKLAGLALPDAATLEGTRQPGQPRWVAGEVLPIYARLKSVANSNTSGVNVFEFSSDFKLTKV